MSSSDARAWINTWHILAVSSIFRPWCKLTYFYKLHKYYAYFLFFFWDTFQKCLISIILCTNTALLNHITEKLAFIQINLCIGSLPCIHSLIKASTSLFNLWNIGYQGQTVIGLLILRICTHWTESPCKSSLTLFLIIDMKV